MSFSQPSAPGTGDKFEAHEHKGHLILVFPKAFQENIKTTKGLSDAADCDIIVVDKFGPDGKPVSFHGARLFGNLARSVRNDIGGQVLGRLNQIQSANGNTPWVLENFNDQDAAAATPVLTAYQQGLFKPTQNPMQQPAATPAQGQWPAQAAPAPQQAPPPAQQWNAAPAPAPAQQSWPTQQTPPPNQWNAAPAATAAAAPPSAPPAPAAPVIDPAVIAKLQQFGINPPPGATPEQIMAAYQSLPQ